MKRMFRLFLILTIISTLCLACAAPTTLTWVWKDETYDEEFIDNIMIIGVSENPIRRRLFEDIFVEKFEKIGVKAVSSAAVIPQEKELTREIVLTEAEKLGADAILVTYLLTVLQKEKFVAPSTSDYPHPAYARFDIYSYSTGVYSTYGGSYEEKRKIELETNIYDAESQMIIWSAKSLTVNPKYVHELTESLFEAMKKDLREKNLIK